jgi:hypothetical protein
MKKEGQYIVGGSRRGEFDRQEHDFYVTPTKTVVSLIHHPIFQQLDIKDLWENAVGNGAILDVFESKGYSIVGSDLNNWIGKYPLNDFLINPAWFEDTYNKKPDIITNPPFKIANDWLIKSLNVARRYVILLLKLSFLESVSRYEIFKHRPHLKYVLIFSERQSPLHWSYIKQGKKLSASSTTAFAWFIWDKEFSGKPQIDWIL